MDYRPDGADRKEKIMSHISTYSQKITDIDFFLDICKKRGYEVNIGKQTIQQFGSNRVDCIGSVLITGWRYKIAITENGELKYDHFGSQAGTMELLGETIQDYNDKSLEKVIPYDEVENYYKETLPNGDIKVVLEY
jgi:uncharacterized protein YmfQ (DUF2313 family)